MPLYNPAFSLRPAFRAFQSVSQTNFTDNTPVIVNFDTEVLDRGNYFAANAWTPPAGWVQVNASVQILPTNLTVGDLIVVIVYKNGTAGTIVARTVGAHNNSSSGQTYNVSVIDQANGTDTYSIALITNTTGGGAGATNNLTSNTYFEGYML